jgi:hypothetical protein
MSLVGVEWVFFGEYSVGKLDIFDLEFFGGKSGKFE